MLKSRICALNYDSGNDDKKSPSCFQYASHANRHSNAPCSSHFPAPYGRRAFRIPHGHDRGKPKSHKLRDAATTLVHPESKTFLPTATRIYTLMRQSNSTQTTGSYDGNSRIALSIGRTATMSNTKLGLRVRHGRTIPVKRYADCNGRGRALHVMVIMNWSTFRECIVNI